MPLIILLVGAGALYYTEAKKFYDQLQYNFNGSKFDQHSSQQDNYENLFLNIKMNLVNPTNFTVMIKRIDFSIIHNGNKIANVNAIKSFTIAGKQSTPASFTVKIPTANILNHAMKLAEDFIQDGKASVTMQGKIFLSLGAIPFTEKVDLI